MAQSICHSLDTVGRSFIDHLSIFNFTIKNTGVLKWALLECGTSQNNRFVQKYLLSVLALNTL